MLTEKDYCDYETSRKLKELGFPTKVTFIGEQATIEIPINSGLVHLYEAQKWLREEKGFDIVIKPVDKCTTFIGGEKYFSMLYRNQERVSSLDVPCTITFEESLLARIKEAVKLLKEE